MLPRAREELVWTEMALTGFDKPMSFIVLTVLQYG